MNKFEMKLRINSYETDGHKQMRPSAFMQVAQEAAMEAAEPIGFGYDIMAQHKATWVLSRMRFIFEQAPVWRQSVIFHTWHRGLEGLMFRRDFQMSDASTGQPLINATSLWVPINTELRRVVRPDALADIIPAEPQHTDFAIEQSAPKVVVPKDIEMTFNRNHVVEWSDTDFIGHTNNVQYFVWALDCLDQQFVSTHPVKEVSINFVRETHLGQSVKLLSGTDAQGNWYVEGLIGGEDGAPEVQSFICKISF